jgi:hypothetical protein
MADATVGVSFAGRDALDRLKILLSVKTGKTLTLGRTIEVAEQVISEIYGVELVMRNPTTLDIVERTSMDAIVADRESHENEYV